VRDAHVFDTIRSGPDDEDDDVDDGTNVSDGWNVVVAVVSDDEKPEPESDDDPDENDDDPDGNDVTDGENVVDPSPVPPTVAAVLSGTEVAAAAAPASAGSAGVSIRPPLADVLARPSGSGSTTSTARMARTVNTTGR
jgi:hypothetical protein